MSGVFVDVVRVYRDAAGLWRWQAKSANGRVVGDSGQGYRDVGWAHRAAVEAFPEARLVIDGKGEDAA